MVLREAVFYNENKIPSCALVSDRTYVSYRIEVCVTGILVTLLKPCRSKQWFPCKHLSSETARLSLI